MHFNLKMISTLIQEEFTKTTSGITPPPPHSKVLIIVRFFLLFLEGGGIGVPTLLISSERNVCSPLQVKTQNPLLNLTAREAAKKFFLVESRLRVGGGKEFVY